MDVGGIVYPLFNKPWALHMVRACTQRSHADAGVACLFPPDLAVPQGNPHVTLQCAESMHPSTSGLMVKRMLQKQSCMQDHQRALALQYMRRARVTEDYILVLDSDMLIRRPMLPADFNVSQTQAASENMWWAHWSLLL